MGTPIDALQEQMKQVAWWSGPLGPYSAAQVEQSMGLSDGVPPKMLADMWAQLFMRAQPYYVSDRITDLLVRTAETFPKVPIFPQDLPSRVGWVYFDRPVDIPLGPITNLGAQDAHTFKLRGVVWELMRPSTTGFYRNEYFDLGAYKDTITVHLFEEPDNPQAVPEHPAIFSMFWMWRLGSNWSEVRRPAVGDQSHYFAAIALTQRLQRLLQAFFAFLDQTIFEAPRARAPRFFRRQAERAGWKREPEVAVVQLRKRETPYTGASKDEHRPVDWQWQWAVSGHWRNQFYPSEGRHKAIWIEPYVKGDPTKPMKPPKPKVFAVVR